MSLAPQMPLVQLEAALPKRPGHGDLFILPKGLYGGGTSTLELRHKAERIGYALDYNPAHGIPDMVRIRWVNSTIVLKEKLVIELVRTSYVYTRMHYDQVLGWVGDSEDARIINADSLYVRLYSVVPSSPEGTLMCYETIYARKMPQEV